MKTTKTFATALMFSLAALGAAAHASPNIEPNNVPFQGVYGTPYEGPSRAQVQAELAAAKAAAKAAGQVWNVEPNDTPFAGVYGTPYNGPSRAQVEADLASAKIAGQVSNVEQRHAVLRRLSRRMSHRRAPPASPATNNPPRVVFRRPRFRGGIFARRPAPASKRITGTWPRSRQV